MLVRFLASTVTWAMEMPGEQLPLFLHGIGLGMDSCLTAPSLTESAGLKAKRAHEQWSQWNSVMQSVNYSICNCNYEVLFLKVRNFNGI